MVCAISLRLAPQLPCIALTHMVVERLAYCTWYSHKYASLYAFNMHGCREIGLLHGIILHRSTYLTCMIVYREVGLLHIV